VVLITLNDRTVSVLLFEATLMERSSQNRYSALRRRRSDGVPINKHVYSPKQQRIQTEGQTHTHTHTHSYIRSTSMYKIRTT